MRFCADLSDQEIQVFKEKGELVVAGHLLSGTDLKVKELFRVIVAHCISIEYVSIKLFWSLYLFIHSHPIYVILHFFKSFSRFCTHLIRMVQLHLHMKHIRMARSARFFNSALYYKFAIHIHVFEDHFLCRTMLWHHYRTCIGPNWCSFCWCLLFSCITLMSQPVKLLIQSTLVLYFSVSTFTYKTVMH